MSCLCANTSRSAPFLSQSSLSVEAETCVCVWETPCLWIKFFSLSCVCLSGLLGDKPRKKKAQNYLYRPFPLQGWTQPLKSAKDVTFCCRWTHHIVHLFNLKSCKTALYLCLFVFLQISSDDRRETERLVACRVFLLRRLEHLRTL